MSKISTRSVLILGGAGFIGSNLAGEFLQEGYHVSVLDGLMKRTGGRIKNLKPILGEIEFIPKQIEKFGDLKKLLIKNELIIDCMAWTSHLQALADPDYDKRLNLSCHLHWLDECLPLDINKKRIIYLGSRGQYGCPNLKRINERTASEPNDIQGIHKLAAESYFRVYAKHHDLNAVSLRIPNCFGENQMTSESDIGLVGGLIRDLITNKTLNVFGTKRQREIVYVKDLCEIVMKVAGSDFHGFEAYNIGGKQVGILTLVKLMIDLAGKGNYRIMDVPKMIKEMDSATGRYSTNKLSKFIGKTEVTPLRISLKRTIDYFKGELT